MKPLLIAAVNDLFFAAKIRATAEHLSVKVHFARNVDAVLEAALAESVSLIIVDLHAREFDFVNLAQRLKADERLRNLPLLGFFSHVQTELQQQAIAAGYDRVVPRSAFTKQLPDILEHLS